MELISTNKEHNFNEVIDIKMRKQYSPYLVKFYSDPADNHFIIVELVRYKDQAVKCTHYILASDLAQWVRMYRDDGFFPVADPVPPPAEQPKPKRKHIKKVSINTNN